MKNNFKQSVIDAIAETQDGHLKSLGDMDDFSKFILARIDWNASNDDLPHVDVESLITDFEYMISQLKSAIKPLEEFMKRWPETEIDPNTKYTTEQAAKIFGVSVERIKEHYAKNAQGLEGMHKKALATGKKVNGYNAEQLEKMITELYEKSL